MNSFKIIFLCLFINSNLNAQYSKANHWVLAMGLNAVDDDGRRPILSPANYFNDWNCLPFPSVFSFEYYMKDNFSIELSESLNTYQVNALIDGFPIQKNVLFIACDLNAKYSFNSLYKKIMWFDPYLSSGFGVTHRNYTVPTFNAGGGATFWVGNRLGINIQTMGKLSFSDKGSLYFQNMLGVKYQF